MTSAASATSDTGWHEMEYLVHANTPQRFWRLTTSLADDIWSDAIADALHASSWPFPLPNTLEELLGQTLGEGQFGPERYSLSKMKRLYYSLVRPVLPPALRSKIRSFLHSNAEAKSQLGWPIEDRYVAFQRAILTTVFQLTNCDRLAMEWFWPNHSRFAVCLTHDVEAEEGHDFIPSLIELEERHGFRSSFNFVPADYAVDLDLLHELRSRGFEVGVHGYTHDGRLFSSRKRFENAAKRINVVLAAWEATGFRSPSTHRQPEWMQQLNIDYDLSFFDTDPFEPMPGGTMSIWPFLMGRFVELPYTLPQDHTLFERGERSPRLWQLKTRFIRDNHGLVLVNVHPDYLRSKQNLSVYEEFLDWLNEDRTFWHALPKDIAARWRARLSSDGPPLAEDIVEIQLHDDRLSFDLD